MEAQRTRRRYDHRFRSIVHKTGDIEFAVRKGVPRSTARDWSRLAPSEVLTDEVLTETTDTIAGQREYWRARVAAGRGLVKLGPNGIRRVLTALQHDSSDVRRKQPRPRQSGPELPKFSRRGFRSHAAAVG